MDDQRYTLQIHRRNPYTRLNADALPEPNAQITTTEFESNLRLGRLWAGISQELAMHEDVVRAKLFDDAGLLIREWVRF